MRTKEEVIDGYTKRLPFMDAKLRIDVWKSSAECLTVEVLLDIRDELQKMNSEQNLARNTTNGVGYSDSNTAKAL